MNGYPGSKAASGAWQKILALMPAHDCYIEPYFGGGTIFYKKRPALQSLVNDVDAGLIRYHELQGRAPSTTYVSGDALRLLSQVHGDARTLVYCDPPYHPEARSKKKLYTYETDHEHHVMLLRILKRMRCNVMLSGYRCALYDQELADWHRLDYQVMTRGGARIESCWCNFTPGETFHDPTYNGADYRERERIKKKRLRWARKFRAMPAYERAVIAEALALANTTAADGGARSIAEDPHAENGGARSRDLFDRRHAPPELAGLEH